MKVSIEISLYPLSENYESIILEFLERLRQYPGLEIQTNGMSTQLFGEMDILMDVIRKEMENVYNKQQAILTFKMGRGELKYNPN